MNRISTFTSTSTNKITVKMCITATTYECGHTEEAFKECKHYQERVKAARKAGFWKRIFKSRMKCTLPKGRSEVRNQKCSECITRDEARRRAKQSEECSREEMERRRWELRWTWVCERCAAERRESEKWQREANGGACCARGLDEFAEWDRRQGYRPLGSRVFSRAQDAEAPRAPARQEKPNHKRATSLELAKREADAAASRYRWRGDRLSGLPYDIVKGFVAMPGTDLRELPDPLEPQPLYEEPGIDWDRWHHSSRTAHGNYPPPAPPPNNPLPLRPLGRSSTSVQARVNHPVEPHRNFSVPAPARTRATSVVNPRKHRHIASSRGPIIPQSDENGVSPPSSPERPRPQSPVAPMKSPELRSARSTISNLNHQLDAAMDYFRDPVPAVPTSSSTNIWQH